jgi:hypothetical protein
MPRPFYPHHWIEGWVGTTFSLDVVAKGKNLSRARAGNLIPVVRPVA